MVTLARGRMASSTTRPRITPVVSVACSPRSWTATSSGAAGGASLPPPEQPERARPTKARAAATPRIPYPHHGAFLGVVARLCGNGRFASLAAAALGHLVE